MHVGLNLLYLIPGVVGGTETYAKGLLAGLARSREDIRVTAFVAREAADWPMPNGIERVVCDVAATSRSRRYAFEQVRLPRTARALAVDVLHSLGYVGPIWAGVPHVLTIPDMNVRTKVHRIPWLKSEIVDFFMTRAARRASEIITISAFSRSEIARELGIASNRIAVTHLGTREDLPTPQRLEQSSHSRYLIAFSGSSAHKNMDGLVKAFAQTHACRTHRLMLVGKRPERDIWPLITSLGIEDRIDMPGYVTPAELANLLANAALLVFPSHYEGFGLPILEAQTFGVPVASSLGGSLPEVAGAGATYFNSTDITGMAAALDRVISESGERTALIAAGKLNAARFSWDKCAAETIAVYRRAVGAKQA